VRVLRTIRRAEYVELVALVFIQGAALGMWFVPLSTVLDAHGLHAIKPYAFATSALAAFVSPLIFGAMADRHASPVKVLRGLALATAVAMALASAAIQLRWSPSLVLALIQLHALCSSPTWSISSTIVWWQTPKRSSVQSAQWPRWAGCPGAGWSVPWARTHRRWPDTAAQWCGWPFALSPSSSRHWKHRRLSND
jgi:MFS family permease